MSKYGLHSTGKKIDNIDPEKVSEDGWEWYESREDRDNGIPEPTQQEVIDRWRKSTSLSRRKFKIGISLYEIEGETLKAKIESALQSLTEPHKTIAQVSYEDGTEFDRMDDMVVLLSQHIGLSDEEVDGFFEWAMNEEWQ